MLEYVYISFLFSMADRRINHIEGIHSNEHHNTPRITLEYTVKSGDTMLAIMERHQHRLEGGDYIRRFIRANQLLPNLRA